MDFLLQKELQTFRSSLRCLRHWSEETSSRPRTEEILTNNLSCFGRIIAPISALFGCFTIVEVFDFSQKRYRRVLEQKTFLRIIYLVLDGSFCLYRLLLGISPLLSIFCPRSIEGCLRLCVVLIEECCDCFLGKAQVKTGSIIRMNIFAVIMAVVP